MNCNGIIYNKLLCELKIRTAAHFYLTVITILAFLLLKVVTVMVAFPFFLAVTLPLVDTVATFLLLVL